MRSKRLLSVGIFVAAILAAGGLIFSTFGQSTAATADETAAANEATATDEAQPTSVIIAGVEYPVNEYGLSYGDPITVQTAVQAKVDEDVNDELEFEDLLQYAPDLVIAATNEGESGYILAESFLRRSYFAFYSAKLLEGQDQGQLSAEDSAKFMSVLNDEAQVLTVYAADGTTEIGRSGYTRADADMAAFQYQDQWFYFYKYPNGTFTFGDGKQPGADDDVTVLVLGTPEAEEWGVTEEFLDSVYSLFR